MIEAPPAAPCGPKLGLTGSREGKSTRDPRPEVNSVPGSALLTTYLNDHLAGATAGRELAKRSASSNRGSSYGSFLVALAAEIDEDRDGLSEIMRALDISVDHAKVIA